MAVEHAVDVDHRDYHEDEHLLQQEGADVVVIDEEVNDALHGETSSSLAWMHPGRYEYHWLLEPLRPAFLREQLLIKQLLILAILVHLIMRGDGQQMHIPILWTLHQDLLIEVKLLSAVVLIKRVQVSDVLGIGVRIGEGELYLMALVFEEKLKGALELAVLSHYQW